MTVEGFGASGGSSHARVRVLLWYLRTGSTGPRSYARSAVVQRCAVGPERAELQRLRDELTATAPAGDPPGPQVYTTIWPPQLKRAVTFYEEKAGQMLNNS